MTYDVLGGDGGTDRRAARNKKWAGAMVIEGTQVGNQNGGISRPADSAADAIAAQLARRILDGSLAMGDRLPPERSLAESFSASRGTVREALRSLSARGLVARRVGSGTFVIYEPDAGETDVSEITSPLELVEVRAAIEPQMARLAVRNATARDMAALERAVAEMEGVEDAESFSLADELFHLRLAEATHNPLIVEIYHRINHVRAHQQWDSIKNKILTPEQITAYNAEHRALLAALSRRDADRAVKVLSAHMDRARADLLASAS
ncbi:MAG: FadR/GntR family transcriptional regulator [Rhodospirillaceae bacterium]|nr:FadR/GntR family transcriptional regulator [Rhodospirillaceae bacterium]